MPRIRDAPDDSHRRGDLHTVTNALGHITTVETYDPHGRPTRVLDPNGVATEHTYDGLGRVTETRVAAGTPDEAVTGYDYNRGNLQFLTAPNGVVTEYRYDANNQLTHIIDGAGQQWTVWERNKRGEILEIRLREADETLTFKERRELRKYYREPRLYRILDQPVEDIHQTATKL